MKTKLKHQPVTTPPKGQGYSFITSPKVDAYQRVDQSNWADFVADMKRQASYWAFEACPRVRCLGGYRYPAIGVFGSQKFAVFVPTGDPVFASRNDMQVVALNWPDSWNVT